LRRTRVLARSANDGLIVSVAAAAVLIEEYQNVRFWPKADIPYVAFDVAFGGKADMAYCNANVR
jgi:hypothetical protein